MTKTRVGLYFRFLLFYLCIPLFILTSCQSWFQKPSFSKLVESAPAKPFLWKISKDQQEIYLFGTIHQGFSPKLVPEIVYEIFDQTPTIVMEVDLTKLSISEWRNISFYQANNTLNHVISSESFEKLQQYLPHMTLEQLSKMKPATAYAHLISTMSPSGSSMDDYLTKRAYDSGKKFIALETPLFQSKLLEKIITPEKLQKLILSINDRFISNTQENIYQTFYFYKLADADQLTASINQTNYTDLKLSDEEIYRLIDERNQSWLEKIKQHARMGKIFVAVGAAHLGGTKGLLKLFQNDGYLVSKVE